MYEKPEKTKPGPREDWERVHRIRPLSEIFKLEHGDPPYTLSMDQLTLTFKHYLMDVAHALRIEKDIYTQSAVESVIDLLDTE